MTTTNPTALVANVTEVRPVRMYPGYMEDHSALGKIGTVGTYVHGPDSDGDIMVKFPDATNWYVREWEVVGADTTPAVSDEPVLGTARITVTEAFTQRSLGEREIAVRTDMLDTMNDRKWYVSVEADGVSGGNFFRGTPIAALRTITKSGAPAFPRDLPGWQDGLRVRITAHDSMTRLVGKEGTTITDGSGFACVTGVPGEEQNAWANWTSLEVLPEPKPEVVMTAPVVEDSPEVARLRREVERLQQRETDLVEAMHDEARRRGWGDALKVVLTEVGLPMRKVQPRINVDVKRSGGLHLLAPNQEPQITADRLVHGTVTWTERVTITLPEREGCDCQHNREVIRERHLADIQAGLRDLGLRRVADEDIAVLTMRCSYCGG